MYLGPLNSDRLFKKVFSDLEIAKSFLEDFLDIKIDDIVNINKQDNTARVTDDATIVEFDFRCEVNGQFIIIDMQQWYKQDIIQRFYLYHCLNTSLQLQDLDLKSIYLDKKGKEHKVKDYRQLYPAITIVWLVDDSLGTDRDIVSSFMQPEELDRFINEDDLWANGSMQELKQKRKEVLEIMNNDTKDLDFLSKNKLTFALQKNIVANINKNKENPKYAPWFALAAKSRDEKNREEDFKEFETDEFKDTYIRVKKRICKTELTDEELDYITDEAEHQREIQRGLDTLMDNAKDIVKEEFRMKTKKLEKKLEEKMEVAEKKVKEADKKAELAEENLNNIKIQTIINMNKNNIDVNLIASCNQITVDEVQKILNDNK